MAYPPHLAVGKGLAYHGRQQIEVVAQDDLWVEFHHRFAYGRNKGRLQLFCHLVGELIVPGGRVGHDVGHSQHGKRDVPRSAARAGLCIVNRVERNIRRKVHVIAVVYPRHDALPAAGAAKGFYEFCEIYTASGGVRFLRGHA